MANGIQEPEQATEVSSDFPYRQYMSHKAWHIVENAISELEKNDDMRLQTAPRYVVGFLIKRLAENSLLRPAEVRLTKGHKSQKKSGKFSSVISQPKLAKKSRPNPLARVAS